MPISAKPYNAEKKFANITGKKMAYFDVGEGDTIIFQHGNPTSSYLWRNIMPHCEGLGRLIACDLIGMGDSDKLDEPGPDSYSYTEHRDYLFGLWDHIGIGDNIVFVLHDWGSALGFDWAQKNSDRVQGIAYMEALVAPLTWEAWPDNARQIFQGFRSDAGEDLVLNKNLFVEGVLPNAVIRDLATEEMAAYRAPFSQPGETRRPTLSWPRQIPIDGEPAEMVETIETYASWLATSNIPKLFVNADPGSILIGEQRELCRSWPNQREVTVKGLHFVQEDSPDEIGQAVSDFVKNLRG